MSNLFCQNFQSKQFQPLFIEFTIQLVVLGESKAFFHPAAVVNNNSEWNKNKKIDFALNMKIFQPLSTKPKIMFFSTTNHHRTKLPYNSHINNDNNKHHQPQQQNVQNERKITDHLTFNHDHYQLNGINWRQRFKRAANNLFEDNELFANYESSQNDGNNNKLTEERKKVDANIKIIF